MPTLTLAQRTLEEVITNYHVVGTLPAMKHPNRNSAQYTKRDTPRIASYKAVEKRQEKEGRSQ